MVLIAGLALAARVCQLGSFSLWLDEIFTMHFASQSLMQTLNSCANDSENLPMYAVITNLCLKAGLTETMLRLVPIGAGVASIILLCLWTRSHFGPRVAALTGLFCALSPFHIRYSQELRAYPYLLFFAVMMLVVTDRLLRRPSRKSSALCALVFALGCYSHLLFSLILAPVFILACKAAVSPDSSVTRQTRKALVGLGSAVAIGYLLFMPWAIRIASGVTARMPRGRTEWTWHLIAQRWQFLTAAAREGDDLLWSGWVFLFLVLSGVIIALRSWSGRALIVGAITGTFVWELVLYSVGHWSDGRYDIMAWPFLMILAALGLSWLWRFGRRPILAIGVLVAVLAGEAVAVNQYQRIGRPSWHRMAEAIALTRRPGERLLTENDWCKFCLTHYFRQTVADRGHMEPARSIEGDVERLARLWPPGQTALLVIGRLPASLPLRRVASRFPKLVEYHTTGALYRLTPENRHLLFTNGVTEVGDSLVTSDWPEPAMEPLLARLAGQPLSVGDVFLRFAAVVPKIPAETTRIDFDRSRREVLLYGWSSFEETKKGVTFVWAVGHESAIRMHCHQARPRRLSLRLRPSSALRGQRVRGLLNGQVLGEVELTPGMQILTVPTRAANWRVGANLLILQFRSATSPAGLGEGRSDRRGLAAAFDWLVLEESNP